MALESSWYLSVTTLPPARTQPPSVWYSNCKYTEQGCVRNGAQDSSGWGIKLQSSHQISPSTSRGQAEAKHVTSVALQCMQCHACTSKHQGLHLQWCSTLSTPEGLSRSCFCSASLRTRPPPFSSVMLNSATPQHHPSMTVHSTKPPKIKRR